MTDPLLHVKSVIRLKNKNPATSTEEGAHIINFLKDYFIQNGDIPARDKLTDALEAYSSSMRQPQSHPDQDQQLDSLDSEPVAKD